MKFTFNLPNADKEYTYHDPVNGSCLCIDHLHVSSCLYGLTQCVQMCNLPLNPSKHMPILIHMNVDILHLMINEVDKMGGDKPIAWHRVRHAKENMYRKHRTGY